MKILPTIFAALLVCLLQMSAYTLQPSNWTLAIPFNDGAKWFGVTITHSFHYAKNKEIEPIYIYMLLLPFMVASSKKWINIYLHTPTGVLLAWFPGAFANFFQLIYLDKVDNLISLLVGGVGLEFTENKANTFALSFSIGDAWIIIANIYFFIGFLKHKSEIEKCNFQKNIIANKLFEFTQNDGQ